MKAMILGAALACLVGFGPAHAEFPFKAKEAHKALNKAARGLDVSSRYSPKKECSSNVKTVCQYSTDYEAIGLLVSSDTPNGNAESVTVIFVPDGNQITAVNAMLTWGVVMAAVNPKLSKSDRGEVFDAILPAIESRSTERSVRGNIEFSLSISDVIGIWFNASKVDDD